MSVAETIDDDPSPKLRLVRGGADSGVRAAERAVADLLVALGQDTGDEHTRETPRRVAAAYAEMLTSALHGLLREDHRSRAEFFTLAGVRG